MNFLIDYNLKGQAILLWGIISAEGWLDFAPIRFVYFEEVGLMMDSSDRLIWQFAQANQMIIITANRNKKGTDSLEQTILENNSLSSLPIITIGNPDRLDERLYRQRCATRIIEIVFDLANYMGVGRLYVP
jgi:predicted nuclease of predicted toxin-antitoxin system